MNEVHFRPSEYEEWMRLVSLPMNSRADKACRVLAALGHRFMIDHGYANAEAIADCEFPEWDRGGFNHLWEQDTPKEGLA